jgi:hypothetical protein
MSHHSHQESENSDTSSFCSGEMSMAMYTDGFHFSRGNSCLNFLFGSWELKSPLNFAVAMVYSFLLAILLEALTVPQRICSGFRRKPHLLLTIIYALQALLGYLIMLIAMSFSIELFASVLCGLMVGHVLFHDSDTPSRTTADHRSAFLAQENTQPLLSEDRPSLLRHRASLTYHRMLGRDDDDVAGSFDAGRDSSLEMRYTRRAS